MVFFLRILPSILPMEQGIVLGQYLGAFSLMDTFRGHSRKKSDWRLKNTDLERHLFNPPLNVINLFNYANRSLGPPHLYFNCKTWRVHYFTV